MTTDFARTLRAAQGYYELGLLDESWKQLDSISGPHRSCPEVLELEVALLLKEKRWAEGLVLSRQLMVREPEEPAGYIHAAFCLHELGQTREARQILIAGPESLTEIPTYYYNLGCYEAALGEIRDAHRLLTRAFALDGSLLAVARKDPDLEKLWALF